MKFDIATEIRKGIRAHGQELTEDDVGRLLSSDWGTITENDIGKKVYLYSYGLAMENTEQRDKRKEKK